MFRILPLGIALAFLMVWLRPDDSPLPAAADSSSVRVDEYQTKMASQAVRPSWGDGPFGSIDCSGTFVSSACKPGIEKDEPLIDSLIRNQADEALKGGYSVVPELARNVMECYALAAAAERAASPAEQKDGAQRGCDLVAVERFKSEVKPAVRAAALGGNSAAQEAYGEILTLGLVEEVSMLLRDQTLHRDESESRQNSSARKLELLAYARSGLVNPQVAKQLLLAGGSFELE